MRCSIGPEILFFLCVGEGGGGGEGDEGDITFFTKLLQSEICMDTCHSHPIAKITDNLLWILNLLMNMLEAICS